MPDEDRRDDALLRIGAVVAHADDIWQTAGTLTTRQREILSLLSEGLTYEEAATELGVGVESVKGHMRDARQRLGVKSSLHCVTEAMRRGLLTDDTPVLAGDLRRLADRAWAAGQHDLAGELHELARTLE